MSMMKSEYAIKRQIKNIERQMKRKAPIQTFSIMLQVVNALKWCLEDGNDPSRTLADLAIFEKSFKSSP